MSALAESFLETAEIASATIDDQSTAVTKAARIWRFLGSFFMICSKPTVVPSQLAAWERLLASILLKLPRGPSGRLLSPHTRSLDGCRLSSLPSTFSHIQWLQQTAPWYMESREHSRWKQAYKAWEVTATRLWDMHTDTLHACKPQFSVTLRRSLNVKVKDVCCLDVLSCDS
jgi:hypothetical protein